MKRTVPTMKTMTASGFIKALITSFVLLIPGNRAAAQGDLLISPLRIVFEGTKKSQEINLANVGKDTATYAITVVDYRMEEDGGFTQIDSPDAGQNFAGPYIRFFPRKVTLAPNEAQVVKMQLIKTTQMAPGEYRSHLYFRAVPDEKLLGEKPRAKDTTGISISLKPIYGITIPIIIRVGENNADVKITDAKVRFDENNKPQVSFMFNRTGSMSVYGDLTIDYVSPGGKVTQVLFARGMGVYTPNARRWIKYDLATDKGVDYHKGKLHVVYTLQTADKTEKKVEAQVDL